MKQRAVAIVADCLSRRPPGRVVGLKQIRGRGRRRRSGPRREDPRDLEPWLESFKTGDCLQPEFGLYGRCQGIPGAPV